MPYLVLLARVQHVTIGHIVIGLSLHIHSFLFFIQGEMFLFSERGARFGFYLSDSTGKETYKLRRFFPSQHGFSQICGGWNSLSFPDFVR